MRNFIRLLAVVLAVSLWLPALAVLAEVSSNPVKERQKLMRSVGKAMKTTVKMLRGDLQYDAKAVAGAMATMNKVSKTYPTLFPKGSDVENSIMDFDQESSARMEIWSQNDDFRDKAAALGAASEQAMKAAGDKSAFAAVFNKIGNACKACHQKYKAEKQQ